MLTSKEAETRLNAALDKAIEDYRKKVQDGSLIHTDENLNAVFAKVCKKERIFVTDGYRYWNPFQYSIYDKEHFIKGIPLKGRERAIKGLIRLTTTHKEHILETRKLDRLINRGKFRTCPICGKDFIPKRSDAMVCPMMACKHEAWRRGLRYRKPRKKVIRSSDQP